MRAYLQAFEVGLAIGSAPVTATVRRTACCGAPRCSSHLVRRTWFWPPRVRSASVERPTTCRNAALTRERVACGHRFASRGRSATVGRHAAERGWSRDARLSRRRQGPSVSEWSSRDRPNERGL